MTTPPHHQLSTMDSILSRDPALSALAELFPIPALPSALAELPPPPPPPLPAARRRTVRMPECIAIAAALVLVVCLVLGCVLGNGLIALCGLAVTLLFGLGCSVALKRGRSAAPVGGNVRR